MTDEREAELLRAVRFLNDKGEVKGFRKYLISQSETITGALNRALIDQEGRVPCPLTDD